MSERPAMSTIYMEMARSLAKRSTCARRQVGCVIASKDLRRVLSVGYNGNAAGFPNRCDRLEEGNCGCLHAEENAAIACAAPRIEPKTVFVTCLCCAMCAKRLVNLGGVEHIVYNEPYRNADARDIFKRAGIMVWRAEE